MRGARQQSHFLETVRGMQSIRLFGHEVPRLSAWQNLAVAQFNAGIRTQRLAILYKALNGILFGIENVLTIWLGALLVLDTGLGVGFSVGMLFAFVSYKTQFVQRTAALIEKGLELRMLGLHAERIGDIALTETEPAAASLESTAKPITGAIRVRNLSYRYGAADPDVLSALNFSIAAGESVAIVGPSGCGKTTLMKLLLGLLEPSEGQIEIDGMPLGRIGLANYRSAVASVMQDDQLFAGSVAENISFFDPRIDHERVEVRPAGGHPRTSSPCRCSTTPSSAIWARFSRAARNNASCSPGRSTSSPDTVPRRGHQPPRRGPRKGDQRISQMPRPHPRDRRPSARDHCQCRPGDRAGRRGRRNRDAGRRSRASNAQSRLAPQKVGAAATS